MPKSKMKPITLQDELRAFIKLPIDPSLRSLLRRVIRALNAVHMVTKLEEPSPELPSLAERIDEANQSS